MTVKEDLALKLFDIQAVKFGKFQLKSGIQSPIYIDLRLTISYPQLLSQIAHCLWESCRGLSFDRICGVPYTALPFASAISLSHGIPMLMRRKEQKKYGTKKVIEGVFQAGESCLVIEDLITSGTSVLETILPLESAGLRVKDVIVLLDREQGGKANLEEKGYHLHSILGLTEMLSLLEKHSRIDPILGEEVRTFIQESSRPQAVLT